MRHERHCPSEIVTKLRKIEILLGHRKKVAGDHSEGGMTKGIHPFIFSALICTVMLGVIACGNEPAVTTTAEAAVSSGSSIVGSWDWYESTGGIGGWHETPENTGETRTVVFSDDGTVTFYTDDEVTLSSTYTLAVEETIFAQAPLPVVRIEGQSFALAYSFPSEDELVLKDNVYDGFVSQYERAR
jgi:hypothetical protein